VFDGNLISAERYLRLLIERALDPLADMPADPYDVRIAGDALASVGLISVGLVEGLVADLDLAVALRDPERGPLPEAVGFGPPPILAAAPQPRGVAPGPIRLGGSGATTVVTAISFGADGAGVILQGQDESGGPTGPLPAAQGSTGPFLTLGRAASTGPRPPGRRIRGDAESGELAPLAPGPRLSRRAAGPPERQRPSWADANDPLTLVDNQGITYRLSAGGNSAQPEGRRWLRRLHPAPGPDVAWFDVRRAGQTTARMVVHPSRPTVAARLHGRSPGSWWVLGRLWEAVSAFEHDEHLSPELGVSAGVEALLAVGAIDPADRLIHQGALLASGIGPGGVDPALDPRWASPLQRRHALLGADAVWPVAATVDLGDRTVRLDALAVSEHGTELYGACSRWSWTAPRPLVISAFDDRHNCYAVTSRRAVVDSTAITSIAAVRSSTAVTSSTAATNSTAVTSSTAAVEVTWRVWPAIDPAATSLRIDVTSPEREASVEVALR
jgi:hypothetical protein